MALPEPRPGFGEKKVLDIITNAEFYIKSYGADKLIASTVQTLKEYLNFNNKAGQNLSTPFYITIKKFIENNQIENGIGGTKIVDKKQILDAINIDFEKFVKNRNSVRDFSSEPVTKDEVIKAVDLAKYAPSVCNRQGWHVHFYENKDKIKQLLSLQNGNRGFTDSINKLIIITGDTKSFTKYEANQIFVDGGLFAMNLILSLHSLGIGSIALNTDIPYVIEKQMKKNGNIPEHERLIMYLGIGKLKDQYRVAISNRKDTQQILTIHEEA